MGEFSKKHTQGDRAERPSRHSPTGSVCISDTRERSRKVRIKKLDERTFARYLARAVEMGAKQEQWTAKDFAARKRFLDEAGDADTFTVLNYARVEERNRSSLSLPPRVYHWNMSVRSKWPCQAPVEVQSLHMATAERVDRFPHRGVITGRVHSDGRAVIKLYGRCRSCPNCLEYRKRLWIARARAEVKRTPGRVWFATVTCKPQVREYLGEGARYLALRDGRKPGSLTPEEQARYLAKVMYREIQLFLKRLRKGYGKRLPGRFRYICVIEPHKDGHPHAHFLFHETEPHCLQERAFRHHWSRNGFAQAQLARGDGGVEAYIAKLGDYITKDASMFVRASKYYGKGPWDRPPGVHGPRKRELRPPGVRRSDRAQR